MTFVPSDEAAAQEDDGLSRLEQSLCERLADWVGFVTPELKKESSPGGETMAGAPQRKAPARMIGHRSTLTPLSI